MINLMAEVFRRMGREDALALRVQAASLTGTEIIEREHSIPDFDPRKDYSDCPHGTPVQDGGQVWLLLQPHNAAHYAGCPAELRALWGLAHTTDPHRAKPWVAPYGTSGMYMQGECYAAEDGVVYCAKRDNLVHDAAALPEAWEAVQL